MGSFSEKGYAVRVNSPKTRSSRFRLATGVFVLGASACSLIDMSDLTESPAETSRTEAGPISTGGDSSSPPPPPPPPPDASVTTFVPHPGVYAYLQNQPAYANGGTFPKTDPQTLGVDRLTTYGTPGTLPIPYRRSQLAKMGASIRSLDDTGEGTCWSWHIDVHLKDTTEGERYDEESFCYRDGSLFAKGLAASVQKQVWQDNNLHATALSTLATTSCDANAIYLAWDMKTGQQWSHNCRGNADVVVVGASSTIEPSFQSSASVRYDRKEAVMINGRFEDAYVVRRTRELAGRIAGPETVEFYFSTIDGLPLRIHRYTQAQIAVTGWGLVDHTTFDENGSDWVLEKRLEDLPPTK